MLSAAGIYGAIARKVRASGGQALEHRVHTSGLAKSGFVLRALAECMMAPRQSARPALSRQELAEISRAN